MTEESAYESGVQTMLLKKFIPQFSRWLSCAILPSSCVLCGGFASETQNLCSLCVNDLPTYPYHCRRCARRLANHLDQICGHCLKTKPPFERTFPLFSYNPPIIQMIIQLKFKESFFCAKAFAELFLQKICNDWYKNTPLPDLIIPVPLHPKRLRARGFNQALEIAKPIGRRLGISIDCHGSLRIKNTVPQMGLSALERKQNLRAAFEIRKDYADLAIAIVDDVITTGETISEFCKALRQKSRVKSIDVWCCARR